MQIHINSKGKVDITMTSHCGQVWISSWVRLVPKYAD